MSESIKISSVKRQSGTIGNFIADFSNSPIEPGEYSLFSGVFSNSFYNINEYNNRIYFKENSTNLIAYLTTGFYNSSNITVNIKDSLENASLLSGSSLTYTVTINSITNKLSISPSSGTIQILMNTNKTNSARFITGFLEDTQSLSTVTGDSPVNLTYTSSYNIRIDGHGVLNYLRDNNNNFYSFSVPVMSDSLSLFFYEPNVLPRIKFENRCSRIRVMACDDDGNIINLQNDFYFILNKCS